MTQLQNALKKKHEVKLMIEGKVYQGIDPFIMARESRQFLMLQQQELLSNNQGQNIVPNWVTFKKPESLRIFFDICHGKLPKINVSIVSDLIIIAYEWEATNLLEQLLAFCDARVSPMLLAQKLNEQLQDFYNVPEFISIVAAHFNELITKPVPLFAASEILSNPNCPKLSLSELLDFVELEIKEYGEDAKQLLDSVNIEAEPNSMIRERAYKLKSTN